MARDRQQKTNTVTSLSLKHTLIIAAVCLVVGFLTVWVAWLNNRVNNHIEHISQDIKVLREDVASLKGDMKGIQGSITKLGKNINKRFDNIDERLPAPPE